MSACRQTNGQMPVYANFISPSVMTDANNLDL